MKTQILFFFLSLTFFATSQDTLRHYVFFDVDKDIVVASEENKLKDFLTKKKDRKINAIKLSGHTDSDGSNEYNDKLSQRRVNNVKSLLEKKLDASVSLSAHGEERPLNDNSTDQDKQKNRRVEVLLILEKEEPIVTIDLFAELAVPVQEFCINQRKDTIIVLNQGTVVKIRANTFVSNDPCVSIKAKEVYSMADMLGEQLSTSSNGRQLETGGMIYLDASDDGGKELKPQKELNIFMPTTEIKGDMQLFYGEEDPHHGVNWQLSEEDSLSGGSMLTFNSDLFNGLIPPIGGEECKLFFCKIRKALSGKGIRDLRFPIYPELTNDSIQELMDSLGVDNYQDLRDKLIEQRVRDGEVTQNDLSYYAFSSSRLGWMNCDRFTNETPLISMNTGIGNQSEASVNLVFKRFKSVMRPDYGSTNLRFSRIKKDEPVYYVAIKQDKNDILLSIIETKVASKAPDVDFKNVSVEELKRRLAALN